MMYNLNHNTKANLLKPDNPDEGSISIVCNVCDLFGIPMGPGSVPCNNIKRISHKGYLVHVYRLVFGALYNLNKL